MSPQKVYCIDENQGYTHKCVDHHSGECARPGWCQYQMSETLKKYFADKWNERAEQIEQNIKDDIAETLGLSTFASTAKSTASTEGT